MHKRVRVARWQLDYMPADYDLCLRHICNSPAAPPLALHIPHPGPHHPYPKRTFPWVLDLVCVEKLHEHLERPGLRLTNGHT